MFKLTATLLVVIASSFAFARDGGGKGILVTPYLGYEMGTVSYKLGGITDTSLKTSIIPLGVRLGYSFGGFWTAADVTASVSGSNSYDKPVGTKDDDVSIQRMGLDLGWQFDRVNLWANYIVSNKSTQKSQLAGSSENVLTGSGYSAGFGYMVTPKFTIELVYHVDQFKKGKFGSNPEVDLDSVATDYTNSAFGINFAFPFTF